MADYKTLINQLDTNGFILGNVVSTMDQGGQFGGWELVGTLYRKLGTVHNCWKSRTSGQGWNGAPIGVQSNPEHCSSQDTGADHTLYRPPPDIIINYDNNSVIRYEDPSFGKIPSGTDDPCDCVGLPKPPTNLQGVLGGSVVVLTWDLDPADHDINVDVWRSQDVAGAEGFLATWGGSNQYIDGLVAAGHTYYYKLKARNAAGVSEFSAEVAVTV